MNPEQIEALKNFYTIVQLQEMLIAKLLTKEESEERKQEVPQPQNSSNQGMYYNMPGGNVGYSSYN